MALVAARLAALVVLLAVPLAVAQTDADGNGTDGTPFDVPPAIRWAMYGPREAAWTILGGAALGALVAAFSFVGGEVPGTLGATDLKVRRAELEAERKLLRERLDAPGHDPESLKRLEGVDAREALLLRERRWQQAVASSIYVVVGVLGAFLFAENLWTAIGVGLAGPAALGVLLKSRAESAVAARAVQLTQEAQSAGPAAPPPPPPPPAPPAAPAPASPPSPAPTPAPVPAPAPMPNVAMATAQRKLRVAQELMRR